MASLDIVGVCESERLVLPLVTGILPLGPLGIGQSSLGLDEAVARGVVQLDGEHRHLALFARGRSLAFVAIYIYEQRELVDELLDLLVYVGMLNLPQGLVMAEVADGVGDNSLDGGELAATGGNLERILGDGNDAVLRLDELTVEVLAVGDLDGVDGSVRLNLAGRLDVVVLVA